MKLLLDTHVLIWALYDPAKLTSKLRKDLENPETQVYFSSISALEICIKIALKKLLLEPEKLFKSAAETGFVENPFLVKHSLGMLNLPSIHSDPFDRALIAQARIEKLTLVTKDENIQKYSIDWRWN